MTKATIDGNEIDQAVLDNTVLPISGYAND